MVATVAVILLRVGAMDIVARLTRLTVAMPVAVVVVGAVEVGARVPRKAAVNLHGAADSKRPSTATPVPILHPYS